MRVGVGPYIVCLLNHLVICHVLTWRRVVVGGSRTTRTGDSWADLAASVQYRHQQGAIAGWNRDSIAKWGSVADNPTSSTSHSSLGSRLSRVTPRAETGGRDTPDKSHPDLRETECSRVIPSGLLRHAMGCNPGHLP